jgi:uncharacterized protein (TIGR02265 family)
MAQVSSSMFEGLFVRGVPPTPQLKEKLRSIGVDLDRLDVSYPQAKFKEACEAAAPILFPAKTETEAMREFGRVFVVGFRDTIVGKMAFITLPLLTPAGILDRTPRFVAMASDYIDIQIEKTGEKSRRMTFNYENPMPEFFAGLFESALRFAKGASKTQIEVQKVRAAGFELVISW